MSPIRHSATALLASCLFAAASSQAGDVHPAYITSQEVQGQVFKRSTTVVEKDGDGTALDVTAYTSHDRKFTTGMYKAGPEHEDHSKGYENDEFIFLIEGSIRLTSADGKVIVVGPGEAATIPKGWKGKWDTDGYTKLWAIYDPTAK